MSYFINPVTGSVFELVSGNRLTRLIPLFEVDPNEEGIGAGIIVPPVSSETAPTSPQEAEDDAKAGIGTKRPYTRRIKAKKSKTEPKKKGNKCGNCGEYGHNKSTCKFSGGADAPSKDASEAMNKMRFTPITPDKLHTIKSMLSVGESIENIADETGVEEDRIARMKEQIGL